MPASAQRDWQHPALPEGANDDAAREHRVPQQHCPQQRGVPWFLRSQLQLAPCHPLCQEEDSGEASTICSHPQPEPSERRPGLQEGGPAL